MRKPLRALADIRVGHSFRTAIEDDPHGDIRVLQIRDIRSGAEIPFESLPRMAWSTAGKASLLKAGDVVIPARGEHYDATLIRSELPTLASAQLYVMHPKHRALTSEYLCWCLNRQDARNYILKNRAGTGMPTLGRQVLEALPIPVPDLATQRKIVELQQLWLQERSLTQQLLTNRRKMLDGIFSKLLES